MTNTTYTTYTFTELYAGLNADGRRQLAQKAGIDDGLLSLADRSNSVAGWIKQRIADAIGEPVTELFPRRARREDEREPRDTPADRPESWLRHARRAVSGGPRS